MSTESAEHDASATDPDPDSPERGPLRRSRDDRVLLGVFGGLVEHLNVDPVILRLVYLGLVVLSANGLTLVLLYFLAWLVIPLESE